MCASHSPSIRHMHALCKGAILEAQGLKNSIRLAKDPNRVHIGDPFGFLGSGLAKKGSCFARASYSTDKVKPYVLNLSSLFFAKKITLWGV